MALIPARGGSKRIKNKNLKLFCGKPIIEYSIDLAIESRLFDEVMVSTDSKEISILAKKRGASIPFLRSKKNSDDYTTLGDVIFEVVEEYSKRNKFFDEICCILPTAPFVTVDQLISANSLLSSGFNSVFPVFNIDYPIQRALKIDNDKKNSVSMIWPKFLNTRTQDLEKAYIDSGQFYFLKTKAIYEEKAVFNSNSGVIVVDENEVHDIDTIEDWKIAEKKYKLLK